jgi:peptide deformylase
MPATKDSIITLPNSRLRQISRKVGLITPAVHQLIDDMKTALIDWEDSRDHEIAVALAAVQIDELMRIVIIREDFDDKNNQQFLVYINPEITKLDGMIVEDYYGWVPRHSKVKIKAIDENGGVVRVTAEGFLARIFQHEIDHTKGITFVDHIKDKPEAFFKLTDDGNLKQLNYQKEVEGNKELWNS